MYWHVRYQIRIVNRDFGTVHILYDCFPSGLHHLRPVHTERLHFTNTMGTNSYLVDSCKELRHLVGELLQDGWLFCFLHLIRRLLGFHHTRWQLNIIDILSIVDWITNSVGVLSQTSPMLKAQE